MKKALIGLFFLLVLTLASIYIFIPARLNISSAIVMRANTNALFRYLSDQTKWDKWWPGQSRKERESLANHAQFNNYTYRVTKKLYNAVEVETTKGTQIIPGKIIIIPVAEDSLIVQWRNTFATSNNPFIRIQQYLQAVNIKKNSTVLLDSLKSFSENRGRVYKFNITRATLKDTILVAKKTVTKSYPSTPLIYQLIGNLRTYIATEKAKEVDYPMLNVTKKDNQYYEVMVAIPTNRILEGDGNITSKRMIIYKDKMLTADVTGGAENINKAYDELKTYMSDYNLVSPVIHWETLITDRSKETDSTKWVTKIWIPIV